MGLGGVLILLSNELKCEVVLLIGCSHLWRQHTTVIGEEKPSFSGLVYSIGIYIYIYMQQKSSQTLVMYKQ
ncbi:hypothetical protein AAHA92_15064 [Salvia divinorum]|uniref:Uncharacterized protein n=1 Tax=Salvia divinorum TaxID=28513 RepID=A0ABD1HEW4_SALDI